LWETPTQKRKKRTKDSSRKSPQRRPPRRFIDEQEVLHKEKDAIVHQHEQQQESVPDLWSIKRRATKNKKQEYLWPLEGITSIDKQMSKKQPRQVDLWAKRRTIGVEGDDKSGGVARMDAEEVPPKLEALSSEGSQWNKKMGLVVALLFVLGFGAIWARRSSWRFCDTGTKGEGCVECPEKGICEGGRLIRCASGFVPSGNLCVEVTT
jgi:hypothetical protein